MVTRALGALGRSLIALGVLTLLFVAYQLWGTGLLTARAQAALEDDFAELLDQADALAAPTPAGGTPVPAEDLTADERAEADARAAKLAPLLWKAEGQVVARISAPSIELDAMVVAGVGVEALRKGPGHYLNTPLPGMPGNASIAGHRTTWGAPFNRIDELAPGDEITVETVQGAFVYRVIRQPSGNGYFVVTPDRVDVLDQDFTDHPNRLTLTACHPKYEARQRIIVVAELVGEPARFIGPPNGAGLGSGGLAGEAGLPGDPDLTDDPTVGPEATPVADPTTAAPGDVAAPVSDPVTLQNVTAADFGEGLDGDPDAIVPAVLWGLAALTVAAAAWFVGTRWRRWPSYAMFAVPFAVVLFVCFVHIDRALPSY